MKYGLKKWGQYTILVNSFTTCVSCHGNSFSGRFTVPFPMILVLLVYTGFFGSVTLLSRVDCNDWVVKAHPTIHKIPKWIVLWITVPECVQPEMCSERDSPLEHFVLLAPGQPELARLICGAHLGPPVLTRKQKRPRVNSLVCDRVAAFSVAGPPEVLSRMSRPVTQAAERERELARACSQRLKQAAPSLPGESVSGGFADRGALEGYPSHYTSLVQLSSLLRFHPAAFYIYNNFTIVGVLDCISMGKFQLGLTPELTFNWNVWHRSQSASMLHFYASMNFQHLGSNILGLLRCVDCQWITVNNLSWITSP